MLAPPIGGGGGFLVMPVMPELLLPQAAAAAMMPIMTKWYGRMRISACEGWGTRVGATIVLGRAARARSRLDAVNGTHDRAGALHGMISDAPFCPSASTTPDASVFRQRNLRGYLQRRRLANVLLVGRAGAVNASVRRGRSGRRLY